MTGPTHRTAAASSWGNGSRAAGLMAAILLLSCLLAPAASAAFEAATPRQGQTVYTGTPTLVVNFTGDPPQQDRLKLTIDGGAMDEGIHVGAHNVTYTVVSVLKLTEGNHTFILESTGSGASRLQVDFVVNYTAPPIPPKPLDPLPFILASAGGAVLLAGAAAGLYAWARRTRNFTLRKHFLRHPEQVRFIILYIPSGLAVVATMVAFFVVATMPHAPRYAFEYVTVAGAAFAFGPFGLSSVRGTMRTRTFERAFAQFLFELADAVRGGIDPVKAVQELAKTDDGLLRKHLQRAADMLRLGRPMDEALRTMTARMGSPLVSRYAALVGEASSMGGSVAGVLQRAAKDMDDLVKIKAERRRALRQPVFTMYMAFAVLLIMILQIVSFAPNIGDISLGALGGGKPEVERMGAPAMQAAFYHLLLFNAAGAGLLVGSFTEGRMRNGILHAISMTLVACVVYPLSVTPA